MKSLEKGTEHTRAGTRRETEMERLMNYLVVYVTQGTNASTVPIAYAWVSSALPSPPLPRHPVGSDDARRDERFLDGSHGRDRSPVVSTSLSGSGTRGHRLGGTTLC